MELINEFVCQRCGGCCGPVCFSKEEYKAVWRRAKNMGISLVKTTIEGSTHYTTRKMARNLNNTPEELTKIIESFVCPFLDKDTEGKTLCRIYDMRPETCRLFGSRPDLDERLKCFNQNNKA